MSILTRVYAEHTVSGFAVAVGFPVEFLHHPAGEFIALTADVNTFLPAAFHGMADIVLRPPRFTAGGTFAL